MTNNPYLNVIWQNLPRLLSLFETDETAKTVGLGDRYYWAWGLIDFANGTFQGAAHGLARLVKSQQLPDWISETEILSLIDCQFRGSQKLIRSNGSLEEAFPYEGSYCVTALVAYDLVSAILLLQDNVPKEKLRKYQEIIAPLFHFLLFEDEHHALISNHLATASAGLYKWYALTDIVDYKDKSDLLLNRILQHQHEEGWFSEYQGADPGYQSLCTYYLADLHQQNPHKKLQEALAKSAQFLRHFVHPDGSYGGVYGSRGTQFYYPGGFELLAPFCAQSNDIAKRMRPSIAGHKVPHLSMMDEPNLIPMFNAFCLASAAFQNSSAPVTEPDAVRPLKGQFWFKAAGLFVDTDKTHHTVISSHKGGVVYHFVDGQRVIKNCGKIFKNGTDKCFTTQVFNINNNAQFDGSNFIVESGISPVNVPKFTPLKMIILRCLNITLMRNLRFREWIKKVLVKLLLTGTNRKVGSNKRSIKIGAELTVKDATSINSEKYRPQTQITNFNIMRMASKGYWQAMNIANQNNDPEI